MREERTLLFTPVVSSHLRLAQTAQLQGRAKPSPREHGAGGKDQPGCPGKVGDHPGNRLWQHKNTRVLGGKTHSCPFHCPAVHTATNHLSVAASFLRHREYGYWLLPGTPLATSKGKSFCQQLGIIKPYQLRLLE